MSNILKIDNQSQMCEQDVFAYNQQLKHVKTYAPYIVREHKADLLRHLIELKNYLEDLP